MPSHTQARAAGRVGPRTCLIGAVALAQGLVAARARAAPPDIEPPRELDADAIAAPDDVDPPRPRDAHAIEVEPAPPLDADAIAAQLGRDAVPAPPPPPPEPIDVMRAEGVEDPFPDVVPEVNRRHTGVLVGLGFASAAAAVITARMTLLPDCGDERDASTCSVPDGADIGVRWGRAIATLGFAMGGAAFGVLGARSLAANLASDRTRVRDPRRLATGLGATGLALGLATLAVGAGVFGWGARSSVRLGESFASGDTIDDPAVLARVDRTLAHVRVARAGLMTLAVAPMLLASGIALLRHRPRDRTITWAPAIERRMVGVAATVRF